MSTSAAPDSACCSLSGPTYLLLRRLQSLTGIMFGGYLLVHLFINATIAQGGDHYQEQVDKIHSLPFLTLIEWSMIFLPIIYHAFYGIWITVNGRPNLGNYPYSRNVYYLLQRISAVILLLFILFHVLSLKYGLFGPILAFVPEGGAISSIGRHMQAAWWIPWIVYPIGITAAAFHTANGFWAAGITWGLTVSTAAQKRAGQIFAGLFIIMTIMGLLAVSAAVHITPTAEPTTPSAQIDNH